MAKFVDNSVMDAALTVIKGCTKQTVCSSQPANFAGIAAVKLAEVTMTTSDYTIANGTTSGRKATVTAKSGVSITSSGSATHIAHDNGSTLIAVTTCTTQALVSGGTVDIPLYVIDEIAALA